MAEDLKDWSELGEDLLLMIGQRLISLDDIIRTRAVCNPWRRALRAEQLRRFSPSSHWLMLPYCTSDNMNMSTPISRRTSSPDVDLAIPSIGCKGSETCRCFFDVVLHQFHHIEFPRHLCNKTCRGSTMGWLCMVGDTPGYDPEKLRLEYLLRDYPGFTVSRGKKSMEKQYIMRVAMSAEPTTEECIVMAIRVNAGHRLAFCRPAEIEAGWIFVPHVEEDGIPSRISYVDMVFWKDQFYALDFYGKVLVCDFSANSHYPTLSYFISPGAFSMCETLYLVVCPAVVTGEEDELMVVTRHADFFSNQEIEVDPVVAEDIDPVDADDDDNADDDGHTNVFDSDSDDEQLGTRAGGGSLGLVATKPYWTEKFQIFKLNKGAEGWDKVESIGDFALFLGFNTPGSFVSIKDYPGLMPNSIYFTDDLVEFHYHPRWKNQGNYDMGIYDLATCAIQPLYSTTSLHNNPLWISPSPMWLSPSIISS
ncbi:unnamed protein product [Linum trigynum]|uniref:KIB1-4 beta-propeller domain-containing protein n=1 Tax=Linum trigynum TaxID=586398 RepID=A0AAV2G294_9ROSI